MPALQRNIYDAAAPYQGLRYLQPQSYVGKISPFTGSGRRLDGKPLTQSAASASSPMLKHDQPEGQNGTNYSKPTNPASHQPSGRLVFGSNANKPEKEAPEVAPKNSNQEPPQKMEEPKFQEFTGKM